MKLILFFEGGVELKRCILNSVVKTNDNNHKLYFVKNKTYDEIKVLRLHLYSSVFHDLDRISFTITVIN